MMGRTLILIATACAGLYPVFFRVLEGEGWSVFQVCAMRGLIGALLLFLFLRGDVTSVRKAPRASSVMALCFAGGGSLYLVGTTYAPAGVVAALMFLAPIWLIAYELWATGKVHRLGIPAVTLGVIGAAVVALSDDVVDTGQFIGYAIGLFTSFILATFIVAGQTAEKAGARPEAVAFWGLVLMGVGFIWSLSGANWSVEIVLWCTMLGLFPGALYLSLLTKGLGKIESPTESSILQYNELLAVIVYFALFWGEVPGYTTTGGILLIVLAGILVSLPDKRLHTVSS